MGLLDRFGGRTKQEAKQEELAGTPADPPKASQPRSELTQDIGSSTSFGPPRLDASIAVSAIPSISAAAVGRKHAFKLPDQPEFVFEEESAVKRRGWTENLQFYTGAGYLAGGVSGVGLGVYNYAMVKPDFPLDGWKLKVNRLLNQAGSKAKPLSNASAVLGLYFASFESYLVSQWELPDAACTVAAGAVSGALFRCPRGPRQAAAAGLVGVVAGSLIASLRTVFPSL
ncbi:hypothetical protein QJQ45_016899 [Haematococcus lacustris]|nr:hypothetical protein QJQ45_024476 [Haematococcus lacustris]KAJ9506731.1 hypothetical protein QJQ45_030530 [Haematococcus lacustris]KAJ9506759.1 hypothetical protein QJQ45_020254 [Haematococcus lacustris]KAJ9515924.1 hypothetical protein QJQ45_016899 [Haematococcus lacustris]